MLYLNFSILNIYMTAINSLSPMYQINNFYQRASNLLIINSLFSRSFTSIIYSYLNMPDIKIQNTIFRSIQRSALFLQSEESLSSYRSHCYFSDKILFSKPLKGPLVFKNAVVYGTDFPSSWVNRRPTFFEQKGYTCGDIIIAGCLFQDCFSYDQRGGGIHIEQYCSVIIHETIFESCFTNYSGGAAISICKKHVSGNTYEQSKDTNIQYCCFQNCNNFIENTTFGVSVFAASTNITLFFSSTNNCSFIRSAGAQFDIQSETTNSKYVNLTGGKSHYCSSIEYRFTTKGFFIFQTIFNTSSKYSIAFVQAVTNDITVSHCNFVSNTLYQSFPSAIKLPTPVYIAQNFIRIQSFYFIKTHFADNIGFYVNRNGNTATAEMVNCYSDDKNQNRYNKEYVTYKKCHFGTTSFTTYMMEHLFLGDCRGNKTADIIIISPTFSNSYTFSSSSQFSYSSFFSESTIFSLSNQFSNSIQFSNSYLFTKSDAFTKSVKFSKSIYFTNSLVFSKSDVFSFTQQFSKSNMFSRSFLFSKSDEFSNSFPFKSSQFFTKSEIFSQSFYFTFSSVFSETGDFSCTQPFSNSNIIPSSFMFSKSEIFSQSFDFSISFIFTKSNIYQQTNEFSNSKSFSKSQFFSDSSIFNKSNETVSIAPIILKDVTYSRSYSAVFVTMKSVSFSLSYLSSNTMLFTYLDEIGDYGYTFIQSDSFINLPYIIKILSLSYVVSYVPFPINRKRHLTAGQLIAIVCGSTSIFLFSAGIIIFTIHKINQNKSSSNFNILSESDDVELIKEESDQKEEILKISSDDNDLDFWL